MVENAGLTEWPVPLLGRFDPDFLDVPREVIVLTMRTNQKYFACTNDEGLLAPAFVCVANIDANDGGEAIVEGNAGCSPRASPTPASSGSRTSRSRSRSRRRSSTASSSTRSSAPSPTRSSASPSWRAGWSRSGIVKGADADQVERAARLAKADLVTGMVGEFPELQGVIGGYLAEAQGEPKAVADAIRDHYKPVGQGDECRPRR